MTAVAVPTLLGRRLLRAARRLAVARQVHPSGDVLQQAGERFRGQSGNRRPVLRGDGDHEAGVDLSDFQGQVVARQLVRGFGPVGGPQRRLDDGDRIGRHQRQAKDEQRRLRVAQRADLARQRGGHLPEQLLDTPAVVVQLGHRHRPYPGWQVGQQVQAPVAVPSGLVQLHRDAAKANGLPLEVDVDGLLVDLPGGAVALEHAAATQLALERAVLADDEESPLHGDRRQELQGAELSVGDPHVVGLNRGQYLVEQRAFLGVAVRGQEHVGRQPTRRLQDHQRPTGQRGCPGGPQFL